MATDPPQAEDMRYWLRRFRELRDSQRREERRMALAEREWQRLAKIITRIPPQFQDDSLLAERAYSGEGEEAGDHHAL